MFSVLRKRLTFRGLGEPRRRGCTEARGAFLALRATQQRPQPQKPLAGSPAGTGLHRDVRARSARPALRISMTVNGFTLHFCE
jgi:hypothetical protein